MSIDKLKLKRFMSELNKARGEGTIVFLNEQPAIKRIPTGSTHLDLNLGGGWPIGRISMIWGVKSASKTSLCLLAIAQAQKICRYDGLLLGDKPEDDSYSKLPLEPLFMDSKGKEVGLDEAINEGELLPGFECLPYQTPMRILFINQEGTLDRDWAEKLGVDIDNVMVLTPETSEETIDIMTHVLKERLADLIVLDSIAAMSPSKELDETSEKANVAAPARLMNKAFRSWGGALNSYRNDGMRPTILLINQLREQIGVMYGSPDIKPGGKGQEFAPAVEVKLYPGSLDKKTDFAPESEGGHQLVNRVNYKITKNKTYPSSGVGQFLLVTAPYNEYKQGDVVEDKQLIALAENYGFLYKEKDYIFFGKEYKTKKLIHQLLTEDKEFRFSIKRELTKEILKQRLKRG